MSLVQKMVTTTIATCTALAAAGTLVIAQKNDKPAEQKRPKVTLKVNPQVVIAPGRVTLVAELQGGSDDFEEFYCPTIEWQWGDDTSSESTQDCEPYEAGKSQIKRRYTTQHQFRRPGNLKLYFHMKIKDRIVGSATTNLQVQPGLSSGPGDF